MARLVEKETIGILSLKERELLEEINQKLDKILDHEKLEKPSHSDIKKGVKEKVKGPPDHAGGGE